MPAKGRSTVSGHFFLNLDGVPCGFVKSVDGGGIAAEVIHEPSGPRHFVKKHIGPLKYEDFTLQIGLSMTKVVYDWIVASWAGNATRKNGAIIDVDYRLEARSAREFFNALITETTIPAMDASSKEPAYLTLKLAPESTRFKKASGKVMGADGKGRQKLWLPSNFRLEIAGLDCKRVSRIEAFAVKQHISAHDSGKGRDYLKEPGRLEFPNLKIALPESAAQTWMDWHEDFVIKGNNDESREKQGALVFLASDRKRELARVNFYNLGIFRLAPEKTEASADRIKRLTVELYCERMEWAYTGG